jgi:hypothetical protein
MFGINILDYGAKIRKNPDRRMHALMIYCINAAV